MKELWFRVTYFKFTVPSSVAFLLMLKLESWLRNFLALFACLYIYLVLFPSSLLQLSCVTELHKAILPGQSSQFVGAGLHTPSSPVDHWDSGAMAVGQSPPSVSCCTPIIWPNVLSSCLYLLFILFFFSLPRFIDALFLPSAWSHTDTDIKQFLWPLVFLYFDIDK